MNQIGTVAQSVGQAFGDSFRSSIHAISDGISGLIKGTKTWGQALRDIRTGLLEGVVNAISEMVTKWVVGVALMGIKWIAMRLGIMATNVTASETEAVAEAPNALLKSISSYGLAALVGAAAF